MFLCSLSSPRHTSSVLHFSTLQRCSFHWPAVSLGFDSSHTADQVGVAQHPLGGYTLGGTPLPVRISLSAEEDVESHFQTTKVHHLPCLVSVAEQPMYPTTKLHL